MTEIELKIEEMPQAYVGKGVAIIDPKIIEDNNWKPGQILELFSKKKSHVRLWSGFPEDYGSKIIRIDGLTRYNIGASMGENLSVKFVEGAKAEQIVLSPIEKIQAEGLHEYMSSLYQDHVFTTGDTVIVNTQMGSKIQLVVTSTKPPSKPVFATEDTLFKLGNITKLDDPSIPRITYDELGGLKNEIQKIREMVELPMRHPELFEKIGIASPKGVLLYGPP